MLPNLTATLIARLSSWVRPRLLVPALAAFLGLVPEVAAQRPNIIVIMTDDLDDQGAIAHLPTVKNLADKGVTFVNSFVNFPMCGPARVSFLTGQAAHNTGVTHNDGAWDKFKKREKDSLGVWLKRAGYSTAFLGKVINGYGLDGDKSHIIPGLTSGLALSVDRPTTITH
jgi:N-acetylglucosamine-6-sulfatase